MLQIGLLVTLIHLVYIYVQLWDINTYKLLRVMRSHDSRVGCLAWNPSSPELLTSGSQFGSVHIYDTRAFRFAAQQMRPHSLDVCGLSWNRSGQLLASGGNDNVVNVWDMYSMNPWTGPIHSLKYHNAAVKVLKNKYIFVLLQQQYMTHTF